MQNKSNASKQERIKEWDDLPLQEKIRLLTKACEDYLGHKMGYRAPVDPRALNRIINR